MEINQLRKLFPKDIKIHKIKLLKSDNLGQTFEILGNDKIFYGVIKINKGSKKAFNIISYIIKNKIDIPVPQPIKYVNKYNLFIYESLPGKIYLKEFKKEYSKKELWNKIKPSINLINQLHKINHKKINNINKETREELLSEKDRNQKKIKSFFKNNKNVNKISDFQDELFKKYFRIWNRIEFKLVHNDYTLNNIVIDNKKFGLTDFYDSLISDPIKDIASFNVRLVMMANRYPETHHKNIKIKKIYLNDLEKLIIDHYLKISNNSFNFKLRYTFWKMFWLLRMYTFFALINNESPQKANFFISEMTELMSKKYEK